MAQEIPLISCNNLPLLLLKRPDLEASLLDERLVFAHLIVLPSFLPFLAKQEAAAPGEESQSLTMSRNVDLGDR